jgi:hypothetical protein
MKTNISHIYGALTLSKVNSFKSERFKIYEKLTLSKVNGLGF